MNINEISNEDELAQILADIAVFFAKNIKLLSVCDDIVIK